MLKKNLDSGLRSKEGKRARRFWTGPLRTLFSTVTFVALFPVGLAAQATSPSALVPAQAAVYGAGFQTPLRFEGEPATVNQVSLSMGASTLYDDNIFLRNSIRRSDEALSIDSALGITRQTEHLTASFDYVPFFLLYRQFHQYDRLNHAGNLNLTYQLTSRVILGLHDTVSYENGTYPSLAGQQILSGPASPTALNQMIIPYTTRILTNAPSLGLTFLKSQRTSLMLSGGYDQFRYGSQMAGQRLYNGNGLSGGLTFQYRVTEHTSFGILLLHQDTTYKGGEVFGTRLRSQVESTYLSVGSRLSPTVTVTVFGGPQYVDLIGQSSAAPGIAEHFHASGGGSITKEVRKTALDLSFRRSVAESGGLYTAVVSTNATLGVRRRLAGHWEADCYGSAAVNTSFFRLGYGRTDALIGGIDIKRRFSHGTVFHISYNTEHQLSKGTLPISANFDRNQVAAGIDYRFKDLRFGR